MSVKPIVHEIRIQNQVIFLDPPIEYARQTWVRQLHDWIGEPEEHRAQRGIGSKLGLQVLFVDCAESRVRGTRSDYRCRALQ